VVGSINLKNNNGYLYINKGSSRFSSTPMDLVDPPRGPPPSFHGSARGFPPPPPAPTESTTIHNVQYTCTVPLSLTRFRRTRGEYGRSMKIQRLAILVFSHIYNTGDRGLALYSESPPKLQSLETLETLETREKSPQVMIYLGPSPPWGVCQLISWVGTLISQVLQ
jgi:hypothetical protein